MKLFNLFLLFAFVFSFVFSNAKQAPDKVEHQTEQCEFSENEDFDFSFDPFEISEFGSCCNINNFLAFKSFLILCSFTLKVNFSSIFLNKINIFLFFML